MVLAILQNFALLPKSIAPPDGKLNLVSTIWFSILMALFSWVLPGVNALVSRFSRPDLVRNAPWRNALWAFGLVWLAIAVIIYIIVTIKNRASGVETSLLYKELPPD